MLWLMYIILSNCLTVHLFVFQFEPNSGPIQGNTRITITGHNFGSNDPAVSTVRVYVAHVDCVIEYRNGSQ